MSARDRRTADRQGKARLTRVWRRWEQAGQSLDKANEAEEFQAVGMRCRETLLAMARTIVDQHLFNAVGTPPKRGDFVA